jgi:hypothetical protein
MKKNGKSENKFDRKSNKAVLRKVITIVCEGKKSEPNYFKAFRRDLRLKNVHVKIIEGSSCGSDPKSLVNHCDKLKVDDFDEIYCVCDCDRRDYIDDVITEAKELGINIILSNPCFEFWYLLHHTFTTSSLNPQQARRELKKFNPDYKKSSEDIYNRLKDSQELAIANADRVLKHHLKLKPKMINGKIVENPVTYVHELVNLLNSFSKSK